MTLDFLSATLAGAAFLSCFDVLAIVFMVCVVVMMVKSYKSGITETET